MRARNTFGLLALLWLGMGALVVLATGCQSIPAPVPPPYDDAPYVEPGPFNPPEPPPEDLEDHDAPSGLLTPKDYTQVKTGQGESKVRELIGAPEIREPVSGFPCKLRWPAENGEGKLRTLEVRFGADGLVQEGGKVLFWRAP